MKARKRLLGHASSRLIAFAIAAVPCASHADELEAAHIQVGIPAGFAELSAPQTLAVDLFFQNRRVGQVQVVAAPGSVRFLDPSVVAALVPGVAAREQLEKALEAPLAANEAAACQARTAMPSCGGLAPQSVGVVLDRDRFRLDLFVNPALLTVTAPVEESYIAAPDKVLSLINAISGSIFGSGRAGQTLAVQDRLIVASGRGRFVSDLYLDSKRGLKTDQALIQADIGERRYSAGLLYSSGTDLIARRRLVGLSVASQMDTRRDKELLEGTPVVVTLGQRAKVEILQGGNVLSSRIYEAGNQWLDTSLLPGGSYDIILRIAEVGRPVREERRFFARNLHVAQAGHDIVFASAGFLAPQRSRKAFAISNEPYFEAGYGHRLASQIAVDGEVFAGQRAAFGQVGGNYFSPYGQMRVAGVASTSGAYGGLVQFSSQNTGAFGMTVDLRRIVVQKGRMLDGQRPTDAAFPNPLDGQPLSVRASAGTFSQVTGYIGYSGRTRRIGISGSYRSEGRSAGTYSFGPTLRWDLLQSGPFRLSLDAEGAFTRRGRNGFVGLSLVRTGFGSNTTSRFGMRHTHEQLGRSQTNPVGLVAAAAQIDDFAGGRLDLGGGFERESQADTITASANLETPQGAVRGDLVQRVGGTAQYALGFRTLVTATSGKVMLQGKNEAQGAVTVEVGGGRPSDRFEVIVDEAVVGTVRAGATVSVPLVPYREYEVRIRPVGSGVLGYDSQVRQVSLYPGSVARLVWKVEPKVAAFGRLVMPDGKPVRNAIIRSGEAIAQTDDRGYFQMEVTPASRLEVILPDARRCEATVAAIVREGAFASLDTMICTPVLHQPTTIAVRPQPTREN